MILHDPNLGFSYRDYGIMLPISPSRADRIVKALGLPPSSILNMDAAAGVLDIPAGPVLTRRDLERVHSRDFTAALYGEGPNGGQARREALLKAWELIDDQGRPNRYEPDQAARPLEELFGKVMEQAGGTYLACRLALSGGFCYCLGGGMHHARYDESAGFCLINDIMIAARRLQAENYAQLIWIVDIDAHKGCGTAELIHFARERGELAALDMGSGEIPPGILNLSIHMARGWPLDGESLKKARPGRAPLIPADVEILIESGQEDRYISELEGGMQKLRRLSERRAGPKDNWKPGLAIVVDGADPYEFDGLESSSPLKLSLDQCLERDRLVYDYLTSENIPSAWIMAGGYGERAWEPAAAFLGAIEGSGRGSTSLEGSAKFIP